MGWIEEGIASIKPTFQIRHFLLRAFKLGMMNVALYLIISNVTMCLTGTKTPFTAVLSGSMEPGFQRGDVLFMHMSQDPIRVGEIVVYNVNEREIPIVHRVIKVHERRDTGEVDILTKGDNNLVDDISLYGPGQFWLQRHHIIGRAVGFLPYVGWPYVIMAENKVIQWIVYGAIGLLFLTSKD